MKFVLYKKCWWLLDEKTPENNATLYNFVNRSFEFKVDTTGLTTVIANDWNNLDWKGTKLWDDIYQDGYLSPEGVFYGCDSCKHLAQCEYVHRVREEELENRGFVTLTRDLLGNSIAEFHPLKKEIYPTKKQMDFLRSRPDCDYKKVEKYYKNHALQCNDNLIDDELNYK